MKRNRIILSLIACTLTLTGCDDQIMEWQKADGNINSSEIPLELNEKIALYNSIKTYAEQYTPNMTIGLGLGAEEYISNADYKKIADENFQMFTAGNAMKHQSIVQGDGSLDFTTVDAFLEVVPTDIKIYGHNFIWHTQQNQNYLKNLIAPEVDFDSSGDGNYCVNGSFENGMENWSSENKGAGIEVIDSDDTIEGEKILKMTASSTSTKEYDLQIITDPMPTLTNKKVQISFWVKSDKDGEGRLSFSGMTNNYPYMNWTGSQSSWTKSFNTSTNWQLINVIPQNFSTDFEEGGTTWKINFDFGFKPNVTYYIDNVQVVEYTEGQAKQFKAQFATRGTTITYTPKSDEEKKRILLDAMESWIKGMAEHVGNRIQEWDVINEPITDDGRWRGIDGAFGSTDSEGKADTAPTEDTTNGLNLNWSNEAGNGHFYWGYYLGKDYATKAFEYARKYCAQGSRLYVNDYNLETSPNKLAALIDFVKYIDENNATGQPIVDGIGTQMHVTASSITREQIDAMFQTMAATGKLVRVTELDVALGTASPSAEQLELQANVYQMVFESYKANVPEAQQSGITIWTLSDNAAEHEYWLPDESPNLFDGNYNRKHAYKGVCDGIAGKDISEEFSGDDWKNISSKEESTSEE